MDSETYDKIHGSDNWDKLIEPLDPDLRKVLVGYGDLAGAAERAFNNDEGSRYSGYSYYGKSSFFKGVMLPWADSMYNATYFLYTTANTDFQIPLFVFPSNGLESNWIGYIAVSNDEFSASIGRREICVVWRGAGTDYEFFYGILDVKQVSAEPVLPETPGEPWPSTEKILIMEGWSIIYNTSDPNSKLINSSARTQLLARINELLIKYKDEKVSIICTGHSLGASLAVLSAVDLAANVVTPDIRVTCFAFGCPRVGNHGFKKKIEQLPNLKILRITNGLDIVPLWPSDELQYVDVGEEMVIDNRKSPYLKDKSSYNDDDVIYKLRFHDIFGMLHTLSGWNGKNGDFDIKLLNRSLALVNMFGDLLKEEYKIPISWWREKNKGIVLNENGEWMLPPIDLEDHDLPVV